MVNKYPKITIITPSFNGVKFIKQTIKSVLEQNYPNLEYIVVDQGSTDGTLKILKKYRKRITLIEQKRKGISKALNAGLRTATGDIIGWINTDDYFLKGTFNTVSHFFKSHPQSRWLSGDYKIVDAGACQIRDYIVLWKKILRLIPYKYTLLLGNYIVQPSTFWRKKIIKEIGYMDTDLKFNMDIDYYLRIFRLYPLYIIKKPLSAFRVSETSLIYRYYRKSFKEQIKVLKKYFKNTSLVNITRFMNFIYVFIYSYSNKNINHKKLEIAERIDAIKGKNYITQRELHKNRYKFASEYIKKSGNVKPKILDIACGFGYGAVIVKEKLKEARITGVDIDKSAIEYAKINYKTKNVHFKLGDLRKLKIPSSTFDFILCFETIEHLTLNEAKLAIASFYKILKPGGEIFISSPNKFYTILIKFFFKFQNNYHKHEFNPKELIRVLKNNKFLISNIISQFNFFTYPSSLIPANMSMYFTVLAKKVK